MSLVNGPPSLGEVCEARHGSVRWRSFTRKAIPSPPPFTESFPPPTPLASLSRCRIRSSEIRRSSISITRHMKIVHLRDSAVITGAPSENPFPSPFPKRAPSPPRSGPRACRLHATMTVNFSRSLNTRLFYLHIWHRGPTRVLIKKAKKKKTLVAALKRFRFFRKSERRTAILKQMF